MWLLLPQLFLNFHLFRKLRARSPNQSPVPDRSHLHSVEVRRTLSLLFPLSITALEFNLSLCVSVEDLHWHWGQQAQESVPRDAEFNLRPRMSWWDTLMKVKRETWTNPGASREGNHREDNWCLCTLSRYIETSGVTFKTYFGISLCFYVFLCLSWLECFHVCRAPWAHQGKLLRMCLVMVTQASIRRSVPSSVLWENYTRPCYASYSETTVQHSYISQKWALSVCCWTDVILYSNKSAQWDC